MHFTELSLQIILDMFENKLEVQKVDKILNHRCVIPTLICHVLHELLMFIFICSWNIMSDTDISK